MNHRCELSSCESDHQSSLERHQPFFVHSDSRDEKWPSFPVGVLFTKGKGQELQRLVTKSAKKRKFQIDLKFGDEHILGKEMNEEISESITAHNANSIFELPQENVDKLKTILTEIDEVRRMFNF
jgi:hypothetical protein